MSSATASAAFGRFLLIPALILFLSMRPATASPPPLRIGLATFSTGTWATYGNLDGFTPRYYANGLERYEFNKLLALGLYGRVRDLPFFLSLPLQWTSKRYAPGADPGGGDRIAPGDAEIYLGRRIRRVEARAGLIFPGGYDRNDGDPWIGPGNIQATVGAAVNPDIARYSRRWEVSAEGKWAYALDDAVAKSGSWAFYPGGKISFRPSERWKVGLEFLGHWKSSYWSRPAGFGQSVLGRAGPPAQWNAGLVPCLFGEEYLTSHLALGLKAGHSLWGYRDAVSYNASAYLLWFP